jgi:hypothetical protein
LPHGAEGLEHRFAAAGLTPESTLRRMEKTDDPTPPCVLSSICSSARHSSRASPHDVPPPPAAPPSCVLGDGDPLLVYHLARRFSPVARLDAPQFLMQRLPTPWFAAAACSSTSTTLRPQPM